MNYFVNSLASIETNNLKFDSDVKARQATSFTSEEQVFSSAGKRKEEKASVLTDRFTEATTEDEIRNLLSRYELILSRETRPEKTIPIEFNKVICFIDLARAIRSRTGGKEIDVNEKLYLNKALELIEKLLKVQKLRAPLVSQLYFFQGVSLLDLDEKEKSKISLEKSIEIYPKSRFAPSLSLYIADIEYDAGKLQNAEILYRKFYADMKIDEKVYSDYKVAWIKLNQSKIDEAINLFLKIIRESKSKSIVQDSILSVSLALSEKYDENYILDIVDKYEISETYKLRIFLNIYDIFLKNPNKEKFEIWERILKYEKDQDAIFRLMSSGLQSLTLKEQIIKESLLVEKIYKFILAKSPSISKINSNYKEILGEDMEVVMANSLKIYQNKRDRPVYKILRYLIESYLGLNIKKRKVDVASLYLDLLIEEKDDVELMRICQQILLNPDLINLRSRARLLVLLNFEKKYISSPDIYQEKFFKLIDTYLNKKDSADWDLVADKYFTYLVKDSKINEAEHLALDIFKKTPDERNFVRLLSVKYEAKKCHDIVEMVKTENFKGKDVLDYKRECHLLLAEDSKKSQKKSDSYKNNIVEFISLAEGKKKIAAIADYLQSLETQISKNDSDELKLREELSTSLRKSYFSYRYSDELFPIYLREIRRLIELGDFQTSLEYLQDCNAQVICSPMKDVKLQIEGIRKIDELGVANLKDENIIMSNLSYITLLNPEKLVEDYLSLNTNKVKYEKVTMTIASRLSEVDWTDSKYNHLYEYVADSLGLNEKVYIYTKSWNKLQRTKVPVISKRHNMSDQDVMYLISKVQNTRKVIKTELESLSLKNQRQILILAETVEINMANVVKYSPIPKKLDQSKIAEYQMGLDQLAEEFVKQAQNFKEMISVIDERLKQMESKIVHDEIKTVSTLGQWDWGRSIQHNESLLKLLDAKKFYQAAFYLDFLFSNKIISKDDYYTKRVGFLMYSSTLRSKPRPMQSYLQNELIAEKLDELLAAWNKGLLKK